MDFLNNALSFPTAIYSVFLSISIVLALLTVLGLFDFDSGDVGDLGDAGDIGGDAGHALSNPYASTGEAVGILSRFGLNGVPFTIIVTLISLFGWFLSYHVQSLLLSYIPSVWFIYYPVGFVAFLATLYVSVIITAQCCKPLRKVFKTYYAPSKHAFIGQTATVRHSISGSYGGEAILNNDGAVLILKILSDTPEKIKTGDKVVLIEYRPDERAYLVVTEDEFKGF